MIKAEWTSRDTLDLQTTCKQLANNLQPTCNQLTTDCISRQAAIAEFSCCDLTPDGGIDANYAIDFLEQMPSTQQWIPCSERLPSEDGRYLVSYWLMKDLPWISVMYYGKPTFPETDHPCFYVSDDEYGDVEYNDIVAWMPLPEPARG